MSAFRSVSPLVARNPVARAIEKANIRRWLAAVQDEMQALKDGDEAQSLIVAVVETICVANKALEDWEDDGNLPVLLTDAVVCCEFMQRQGYRWNTAATERVCDAVDYACQILMAVSPNEKRDAWAWAQKVQLKAREAVAA